MADIEHDTVASRFFLLIEGHRCVLDYALTNGTMTITHTGVPEALGGRGLVFGVGQHVHHGERIRFVKQVHGVILTQL